MPPSALLSQVTDPVEIRSYFDWHLRHEVALMLLIASNDAHTLARLTGFDAADSSLLLVCSGVRGVLAGSDTPYAVIGTRPNGANFLASGTLQACAASADCFRLSFPTWIDISQARECHRSPAPAGHLLHFSSTDPHLNDITCRARNISLGGLAVEWDTRKSGAVPALGTITEETILLAGDRQIPLGKLRVTHLTQRKRNFVLGLKFEREAPRPFGAVVLDAQRSHYLA